MQLYAIENGELVKVSAQAPEKSPFDPVIDEFKAWREYTKLHKETGDNKYAVAGHEEFRHMLLRLSKALEKIDSMATTEAEKVELANFRKAMTT